MEISGVCTNEYVTSKWGASLHARSSGDRVNGQFWAEIDIVRGRNRDTVVKKCVP